MQVMTHGQVSAWKGVAPKLGKNTFVADGARIIGDIVAGDETSFWFNVVVRGDVNWIRIGSRTNIQDNSVVHVTRKTGPVQIGNNVTIGHSAIIHACSVEDNCLIGMGAVIMDGALIRRDSIVAAGSVVPPGKQYPAGSLIKGSPAVQVRSLTESEINFLQESADNYVELAQSYFPIG